MIPFASNVIGRANGSLHPALLSFLYPTPSGAADATPAAVSQDMRATLELPSGEARSTLFAEDRAGSAARHALLVCPTSPFATTLAEALRTVDARCQIRRATVAATLALEPQNEVSLIAIDLDAYLTEGEVLIRDIASRPGRMPIVAISGNLAESFIDRALNAGASAYLPKTYSPPLVECVLRIVLNGESYRPWRNSRADRPTSAGQDGAVDAEPVSGLTSRERQVLAEIAQGCTNLQIAQRLSMTEATARTHTHHIFRKLNVQNRAEAALRAMRMRDIQEQQIAEAERGRLNLSWLQPEMTHLRMRRNEWIFRSGDVGSKLFYLQRGHVLLPEIDVTLGPGDVFGEVGIFATERKRTCSARCKTEVDLFSLSSEKARRIYFANPQFALFILTLVATRLMAECLRPGRS